VIGAYRIRRAVRPFARALAWRAFSRRNRLGAGECGLITQYGIGDHFLVCALARALAQKTGLRVAVAGTQRYGFIAGLFPSVERFVPLPAALVNEELGEREITPARFAYAHFRGLELFRAVGYRGFQIIDAYRCLLGLDPSASLEPPSLPEGAEVAAARTMLEREGLPPGRTALLCMATTTTPTGGVDHAFWERLAHALSRAGLVPVINTHAGMATLAGLRGLHLQLADFRATAVACGHVYAIRSGLCELACDLPCEKAFIFPDTRYFGGNLHSGTSLSRYGLARPAREFVLDRDGEGALHDAIAARARAGRACEAPP
jgi:hypothetical protein